MRAEGRRAARQEATASGTRLAVPRRCSRTCRSRSASSLSSSSTSLSNSSASSSAAGGGALRFRGLSTAPAWPGAGAAPAMVGKSARSRGEWRAKQPPERDDQATRGAELFQFGSGRGPGRPGSQSVTGHAWVTWLGRWVPIWGLAVSLLARDRLEDFFFRDRLRFFSTT